MKDKYKVSVEELAEAFIHDKNIFGLVFSHVITRNDDIENIIVDWDELLDNSEKLLRMILKDKKLKKTFDEMRSKYEPQVAYKKSPRLRKTSNSG